MFKGLRFFLVVALLVVANWSRSEGISVPGQLSFTGYIKADTRMVDGEVGYTDFWIAKADALESSQRNVGLFIKESRLQVQYEYSDFRAHLDIDLFGEDGNEVVSNSYDSRIRQLYFTYKNVLAGQTWTNLTNVYAYPESVSFGGPLNGQVFIRQSQIRYTIAGFAVALENPENNGTQNQQDSLPDFTARYQWDSRHAHLSVASLVSRLKSDEYDGTAIAWFLAGRITFGGIGDIRFQYSNGNSGRYVSPGLSTFNVENKLEDIQAYTVGARINLKGGSRINAYVGYSETDIQNTETQHQAINYFYNVAKGFTAGFEVGTFELGHVDKRSKYYQVALTYKFSR